MSETESQSETQKYRTDNQESEIDLIDIFRVIWKWKYLIVGGTAICAVTALIISLLLPKVYRLETLIQPGILSIQEEGKNIYIDTPDNIKALIEAGAFDLRILNELAESYGANIPKNLKFKVTRPTGSNTLKIVYETSQTEQGIRILELLGKFLIEEYRNFVEYFQNRIDRELNIAKAEIEKIKPIKQSSEIKIINIDKRVKKLQERITSVNENTDYLKEERNRFLKKKQNEDNILSVILYSNTIQQNLQLENDYENEIKNLLLEKETELQHRSQLEGDMQIQLAEISSLEFNKSNIQNIRILRKPYSLPRPIKPQKKVNVILATAVGVFLMICLSFLLEFLKKTKTRKIS